MKHVFAMVMVLVVSGCVSLNPDEAFYPARWTLPAQQDTRPGMEWHVAGTTVREWVGLALGGEEIAVVAPRSLWKKRLYAEVPAGVSPAQAFIRVLAENGLCVQSVTPTHFRILRKEQALEQGIRPLDAVPAKVLRTYPGRLRLE